MKIPDWGKLEQNFKDATGGLPNYKRTMAWEYVKALAEHSAKQEKEINELSQALAGDKRPEAPIDFEQRLQELKDAVAAALPAIGKVHTLYKAMLKDFTK